MSFVSCCLILSLFFNFDPFLSLEKALATPLYFFKSIFQKSYNLPTQVKPAKSYTLALVGDSMTQFLGDGTDLRNFLKKYYPNKEFGILNFGIGSTSILTVPKRLTIASIRGSETLPPILDTKPDIILLESFGNNPLSDLPLSEGLKKQQQTLDQIIQIIKEKSPETVLIFVATVSPTRERYAEGIVNLTTEKRREWADERIAYIKNHIKYAADHRIPLINVYQKTLKEDGDGNIDFINSSDFIHPSPTGILFISSEIADYLYKNRTIPL